MSAQPLEIRMAHLEGAYEQISERLNGIDSRLTGIDGRITALDQTIDSRLTSLDQKIDVKFETLDKKITGGLFAGLTMNAATLAAVIGAIVAAHR